MSIFGKAASWATKPVRKLIANAVIGSVKEEVGNRMKALEGKKSYLAALGIVLAGAAVMLKGGQLTPDQMNEAIGAVILLGGAAVAAIRAAISRGQAPRE